MTITNKPKRRFADSIYPSLTYMSQSIKEDSKNKWMESIVSEFLLLNTNYLAIDETKAQDVLSYYSKLLSLKTKRKTILEKIKEIENCIICLSVAPCDAFYCNVSKLYFPTAHFKVIVKSIIDIDIEGINI